MKIETVIFCKECGGIKDAEIINGTPIRGCMCPKNMKVNKYISSFKEKKLREFSARLDREFHNLHIRDCEPFTRSNIRCMETIAIRIKLIKDDFSKSLDEAVEFGRKESK